jgi:hypothetical protein
MAKYKVTRKDGTEVTKGDTIHDFRGDPGTFEMVTRGIEYNGTAKVVVTSDSFTRESYASAWNLLVETLPE